MSGANFDHIAFPRVKPGEKEAEWDKRLLASVTTSGERPGYREATEQLTQDLIGSGYTPDAARARAEGVARRHKTNVRRTR